MCSSVLAIVDGVLVAVVLSVWILVPSVLNSKCVVVEESFLWELDLVDLTLAAQVCLTLYDGLCRQSSLNLLYFNTGQ